MSATGAPAQKTWLGNMFDTLKADAGGVLTSILNVVTHDVFPFVENLFKTIALDNVKALAPLAEQALTEVEGELPVLFSQGAEGFLKVFNATVAGTFQKAEAAALSVTETDVITSAHAAVVNAQTALKKS